MQKDLLLGIVTHKNVPETVAHLRVTKQSWQEGKMEGEIKAADYEWQFQWHFRRGKLLVKPSLGRALIYESLGRFLERSDYQLEPGGDYEFLLRAKL
jgi:hypothetical protein